MRLAGSPWMWLTSVGLVVLGAWWLHDSATAADSSQVATEHAEIPQEAVTAYIHRSVDVRKRQRYEKRYRHERNEAMQRIDERLPTVMRTLHIDEESTEQFRSAVVEFSVTMADIMLDVRTGRANVDDRYRREDSARTVFRRHLGQFLESEHADAVLEAIVW